MVASNASKKRLFEFFAVRAPATTLSAGPVRDAASFRFGFWSGLISLDFRGQTELVESI